MSDIEILEVQSKKEFDVFIKMPWNIYAGDPLWVPPLLMDMKTILSAKKNPFFRHSEAQLFLAYENNEVVGRIAAILNNSHNNFHNENIGFFGFFESTDNADVATALVQAAKSWLSAKGVKAMRGPMNLSTNDTCGMLCEGFDSSPVLMMTYNPQYYLALMDKAGLSKIKELYAYSMRSDIELPERFIKFAQKAINDPSINIRKINMREFDKEVDIVMSIYNEVWQNLWGFVPMNQAEFKHAAADMKAAVDPDLVLIAEVNGEPAGFSLALPDFNEIIKDINGRLFPFGLFKLLLNKSKVKGLRVITLGIRQKFQKKRAIAPAFYYETYRKGREKGYAKGEFSWILDDNKLMIRAAEGLGATLYKKYAIYEDSI